MHDGAEQLALSPLNATTVSNCTHLEGGNQPQSRVLLVVPVLFKKKPPGPVNVPVAFLSFPGAVKSGRDVRLHHQSGLRGICPGIEREVPVNSVARRTTLRVASQTAGAPPRSPQQPPTHTHTHQPDTSARHISQTHQPSQQSVSQPARESASQRVSQRCLLTAIRPSVTADVSTTDR